MSWAIDLSRDPAPPRVGWVLLIAGLGAAVSAFAYRQHAAVGLAEADRQVRARLEARRLPAVPARAAAPGPAEVRLLAAAAASRAPWLATLRTIESTVREPVYLRAAAIEPDAHVVRLEAEAPSFAAALAYVTELDESEALRPAWLRSHEAVIDPVRAGPAIRFSVVARWNGR